jgi:murein DD-endopeptidase MepM/ murein hydrolase activator NlpD
MKIATFVLGLFTGIVGTYFFLTRVWWPDVRFPGVVLTAEAPPVATATPAIAPTAVPIPPELPSPPLPTPPLATEAPSLIPNQAPTSPQALPPSEPKRTEPPMLTTEAENLRERHLLIPVSGIEAKALRDNFAEDRAGRHHEAIDILAPRGTPVLAVDDGKVVKLFTSRLGGLTVYQFDGRSEYCYYYAHLDGYAPGLAEGKLLKKGDVIGYVGTTGNSPPQAPHLHFTIFRLGSEKRWWEGTAINAYPLWGPPTTAPVN